jgi:hypothetical protein
MFLRECWSEDQIESVLSWLRHQNARGAHIYVRPSGAHEPSLIDDLSAEAITRMKDRISARPRRGDLTSQLSGLAQSRTNARSENQYLGRKGTREAVRWRSLERGLEAFRSRLAGFTNRKPERRLQNGLAPFGRLRQCQGRTYDAADEFVEEVKSLVEKAAAERAARRISRSMSNENSVRPLAEFHGDPRYECDLHRADMAWALHAANRGLSEQQIRDELLHARDLSKKGGSGRQLDYVQRTATRALRTTEPLH